MNCLFFSLINVESSQMNLLFLNIRQISVNATITHLKASLSQESWLTIFFLLIFKNEILWKLHNENTCQCSVNNKAQPTGL